MTVRTCPLSGEIFEISKREQEFLERIAPEFDGKRFEIPLPTLSPDERTRRRVLHRNEQHLYRNKSAFSGKQLISVYSPDVAAPIVSRSEWFSDVWDAQQFGRDFDFSRDFFEQFGEMQRVVPRAATVTFNNENSEYTTGTGYCKNCYMINSSENCEDCLYSKLLQKCRDTVDSSYCYDSELLYECFNVRNCYDCKWVYHSQQATECWFCDDVRGCSNCFLCTNLVNQSYCFLNEQLSKEDYHRKVEAFTHSYPKLMEALECFSQLRAGRWFKYAEIVNCESCTGDFLRNSKNCEACYDVVDSEDCLNLQVGVKCRDLIDCSNMYLDPELSYQVLGTIGTNNVHFCLYVFNSSDLWYCEQCFGCRDCFGCIGLRNKQYCIFNREYSRDDYEREVAKIVEHMQQTGEWGQFFPVELSPFSYNKSLAQEYFPLSKEQAEGRSYRWEDAKPQDYQKVETIVPGVIEQTPDSICRETLACVESGKNYRIQASELAFHRRMNLPLSPYCPEVRYQRRVGIRRPRKIYDRVCDECGTALKSVFPEESEEKILCETHYLEKVS
ncbi:MAG: hypothetical protein KDD66_17170 [Bdellovibrionales bacterium]|nr:hypothetical protein [Bdellovibrionales bacterium]